MKRMAFLFTLFILAISLNIANAQDKPYTSFKEVIWKNPDTVIYKNKGELQPYFAFNYMDVSMSAEANGQTAYYDDKFLSQTAIKTGFYYNYYWLKDMYFGTGLLYQNKKASTSEENEFDINLKYLTVPFYYGLGEKFYVEFGVDLDYLIGAKMVIDGTELSGGDIRDDLRKVLFSYRMAVGWSIFTFEYRIGFSDIWNDEYIDYMTSDVYSDFSTTTNEISIGIRF